MIQVNTYLDDRLFDFLGETAGRLGWTRSLVIRLMLEQVRVEGFRPPGVVFGELVMPVGKRESRGTREVDR